MVFTVQCEASGVFFNWKYFNLQKKHLCLYLHCLVQVPVSVAPFPNAQLHLEKLVSLDSSCSCCLVTLCC